MTLVNLNGRPAPKTVNYFLDQLLNDFQGSPSKEASVHAPVNITDNGNAYQLELSVPGRNKEDFKLNIENGLLTISYEKKEEEKQEGVKSIRREFSFGSFKRSFTLDKNVDTDNISAKYENGILNIGLPKKAEVKPAVQEISVQ